MFSPRILTIHTTYLVAMETTILGKNSQKLNHQKGHLESKQNKDIFSTAKYVLIKVLRIFT